MDPPRSGKGRPEVRQDRGFTLVEVLVAVTVASLLILGVVSVTRSMVLAGTRQRSDQRASERLARTVEVVRHDWRGRTRMIRPESPAPSGTSILRLATVSDSISKGGIGAAGEVVYVASDEGLRRQEGDSTMLLYEGPVGLEFWDGATWARDAGNKVTAVRLTLGDPPESVVVR
jgi:prepilin-type N-terminal cleavage/methylation domain-containing protein